ncbi:hypothetical protein B0H15DRAFT_806493 [Mycena belliarum]|uniref:Uncharacterized protein n=1 Tax=Mycena belliarum TaxID=1033014 RepID=A0AAD6TR87_9AGAR|nr:hypothetical protein B0H15DRAFT_806493 [Mycena belliae]
MPPRESSPASPSTPGPRPVEDLLALTQQLTPSKSPRTLRKIRHDIQLQANDVQQEHAALKRRAVDAEQHADSTRRPRKKRKRGDRARYADDAEVNAEATETRVRDAGRNFAIQKALFLVDSEVFETKEDQDFDANREFDSIENERQGQLHDILGLLPDEVRPKINQLWVQDSFLDGLHGQRTSIRHRLRVEALPVIADDVDAFTTSASRFDAFSEVIGYKAPTDDSEAFYERFAVPILYDEWHGRVDLDHLFRGSVLLQVFVSIIRGPRGAVGLFEGKSKLPQAKCLERIHNITRITPGAIVISAILTIWLFSADTQLVQVGDETTIDYAARHRLYIRRIREGLRDKKAWAVGLINYWNEILFPNADKSRDGAAGGERLEDDEEIDDIFDQAASIDDPPSAQEQDHRKTSSPSPAHSHHSRDSTSPRQPTPRRSASPPQHRKSTAGSRAVDWRRR